MKRPPRSSNRGRSRAGASRRAGPRPRAQLPDEALSEYDRHLFNEGRHYRLWKHLGAHPLPRRGGRRATRFAVWAPEAERVTVMGAFNGWSKEADPLAPLASSGIWTGVVEGVGPGDAYKYHLVSRHGGYAVDKRDPFAFYGEAPPETASIVWEPRHDWGDAEWMERRAEGDPRARPMSIYEVHAGSWRRFASSDTPPGYRELAVPLAEYARDMGFTHVEFLPLTEHPFYGSWGYQTTGYFAPSARMGTPQDLKHLIDVLHQHGVGVLLDWVPSHFPTDEHGLGYFDGTHLFEHADPRQGFHPDWQSFVFNYGRPEVRSFLVSSALFWLEEYHADGLRVDAVASMLYLDYSRREGEWIANVHGGRENLEAIGFLRELTGEVRRSFPNLPVIAEESTAWPKVSRPAEEGGLGFHFKWDMGWMHDTLRYMARDPVYRTHHHDELTFRSLYAASEDFVLPLSHDEVVHGKGSLYGKMPGDEWQRFANLRLLLADQHLLPGKKLLFMGGELAQVREWNHDGQLQWELEDEPLHAGVQRLVRDLNALHRERPELHERDGDAAGFEWVQADDRERSVYAFLRLDAGGEPLLAVLNATPVPRHQYRVGVPRGGTWRELVNTDDHAYGGSGQGNLGGVEAAPVGAHGRPFSLVLTLPPLSAIVLAPGELP